MRNIEMNFIKPRVQQYTPIWDVLLNKTLNITEICTPQGYTHTSYAQLEQNDKKFFHRKK